MQLSIVCVLMMTAVLSSADLFELNEVPAPVPETCYNYPTSGPCRARLQRYRFNRTTNKCESFFFGGCFDSNGGANIFKLEEQCKKTCVRSLVQRRALNNDVIQCSFSANPTRDCDISSIAAISDVSSCADFGHPQPRTSEDCLERGCCSRTLPGGYHVCYEKKSALVDSSCTIGYASNGGFLGKINFQADQTFFAGWLASLKFSRNVPGDLCILKGGTAPESIRINAPTFQGRSVFQLQGSNMIRAGESVTILFSGGFDQSRFNTQQCRHINLVSGRVIDSIE